MTGPNIPSHQMLLEMAGELVQLLLMLVAASFVISGFLGNPWRVPLPSDCVLLGYGVHHAYPLRFVCLKLR